MEELLVPLAAIIMSLGIPMVVIIAATQASINKKNRDAEIRRLLIENNIDMERAQLLLKETKPKSNVYNSLRGGAALLGMGIGALVNYLWIDAPLFYSIVFIVGFMGLFILFAFIIEYKMRQKEKDSIRQLETKEE